MTAVGKAIEIGALLTTVKEELPHGEWLPWLAANVPFAERTARNYLRVYQNREKVNRHGIADLTGAIKLLTAPKAEPSPTSEPEEHPPVVEVTPEPVKTIFRCENCDHEVEEDEVEENPLYECNDCGVFTRDNSADGGSHRCGGCNKWGHKISNYGCPECGEGELTKQETEVVAPITPRSKPLPPSSGMQYANMAIWQLEKINQNDTQREQALHHVAEWIAKELGALR